MNQIQDIKMKRYQFLHILYNLSNVDIFKTFNVYEIGKELGFDRNLIQNIVSYLKNEGLIEIRAIGGIISITHLGIQEIEKAFSNPEKPTDYFPSLNVILIGQMAHSQIQQSSSKSIQIGIVDENRYSEIREIIRLLKENLDKLNLKIIDKADIQTEIQTIELQMSSSKPKSTIIKECLISIKRILENAIGSMVASDILSKIVALLGK